MDIMKKFLILLAIFCIVGSVAAVSAADMASDMGGYAGSQYNVDQVGGYAGSQYDVNQTGGYAGSQYYQNEMGGYAGSQYNATANNMTGNATPAAHTAHAANATTNTTNATAPHTMLATGNPILILFGVIAAVGGYAALRRRN